MNPTISKIKTQMNRKKRSLKMFDMLAQTFQALGDSSRIQIIWALSHGELAVGEISGLLGMSQPSVSHHLRTLRNLQLVSVRKAGRSSYYVLDDDHINVLLKKGIDHVEELFK